MLLKYHKSSTCCRHLPLLGSIVSSLAVKLMVESKKEDQNRPSLRLLDSRSLPVDTLKMVRPFVKSL